MTGVSRGNAKQLSLHPCIVLALACLIVPRISYAQFTGLTVACDRRYPTDTQVPSKYGTQVIAAKGCQSATPCHAHVNLISLLRQN